MTGCRKLRTNELYSFCNIHFWRWRYMINITNIHQDISIATKNENQPRRLGRCCRRSVLTNPRECGWYCLAMCRPAVRLMCVGWVGWQGWNESYRNQVSGWLPLATFCGQANEMARSQCSEGPATGHLDTGFSWFPCVYKQMLRWFPTFQVATTCFSCSPPDLNLVVTNFMFCLHVK